MKILSLHLMFIPAMIPFLCGCSVFGIRSGYEQLDYSVIEKIEEIEVRQYPSRVVAQVSNVKDDNEAFMLLFRYISGKNSANESVAMTAPVQVDSPSMKIAMTAPVEKSISGDNAVSMRFFLPRSLSAESAPKPIDPQIQIISLPKEMFAAITYSGSNSDRLFQSASDSLLKVLAGSRWKAVSGPSFLGYDPPFAVPFLRRNEAIVKVELQ